MSELPVQPARPASPSAQQTPAPQTPGPRTLPHMPVTHIPPQLQPGQQALSIPGRVVSSDPQKQSLRIDTAAGEIDIKSSVQLPPGTEVTVSLFLNKGAAYATITILKLQVDISKNLEHLAAPEQAQEKTQAVPPLKTGDIVLALKLPEDPAPGVRTAPPPPPSAQTDTAHPSLPAAPARPVLNLEQAVHFLRQPGTAENFHTFLPPGIDAETVRTVMSSPHPELALRALPPAMQEKIRILILSLAHKSVPETIPPVPARPQSAVQKEGQAAPPPENTLDESLLRVAGAQVAPKTVLRDSPAPLAPAPGAPPPAAPTAPPLQRLLGALLPLIETILPEQAGAGSLLKNTQDAAGYPLLRAHSVAPQNMFQLKIIRLVLPFETEGDPPLPGPSAPHARVLRGEVESVTPRGLPVIRTGEGHFVLHAPADLPPGTKIVFEATPMTPQQIVQRATTPPSPPFPPSTPPEWRALAETLKTLEQAAPALAASVRETLPSLPTSAFSSTAARQLAPPALLFLAALRMGDIESWLGGKTLETLRKSGQGALADRLSGDFSRMAEQAQTPLPGGWKSVAMPLIYDERLHQMHFFVRQQNEREGDGREDGARPVTRFLLNLSLSRLGDMQLDGLIHKKQFDLILRTGDALSPGIRQEIMKRFASGLEQTGMQGGVSFQAKRQGWATVGAPPARGTVV